MKVFVLANGANFEKIKVSVLSLGSAFGGDTIQIYTDISEVSSSDIIVLDVFGLQSVLDNRPEKEILKTVKMFLYFRGFFLDAKNNDQFARLDYSLKKEKNWTVLKEINEIRIKLNILFGEVLLDSYPSFLQLELTDACNAECIMCSHLYQKNNDTGFLSEKVMNEVSPILPYIRVAILHGNGEPFLHPDLINILEEYRKYGICVSTSTNLSLFNETIAYYINCCFTDIRVSCDGCTKDIYEQIRRNLSFDKLLDNLTMLKEMCGSVKKMLMVVIMRQNIHQLDQFVPFAKQYGFSEVVFSNMMPSIALGNEEDSPLHFKPAVKAKLMRAVDIGKELGIKVVYPECYEETAEDPNQYIEPVFRTDEEINEQIKRIKDLYHLDRAPLELLSDCEWEKDRVPCDGICDWCMERAYIDLNGNAFVCCINNRYALGNIAEEGFGKVWNSLEMQRVRRSFFDGKLPDFCEACHFILNHSLPNLKWVEKNDKFFARRCISEVYLEHNEKQ